MCRDFGAANGNGPWTRVVLGWMYEKSQCQGDDDLWLWCEKLGRVLSHPYFVKYRVDPAMISEMVENTAGNLGLQIWCSSREDAAIVRLVYSDLVVAERVFQGPQMQDTLRWMGASPITFREESSHDR